MNLLRAAAVVTLWKSGRFDTLDIAEALGVEEASVVVLLDAVRNAEHGPDLKLLHGGVA